MTEKRNAPRLWWICLALAATTLALYSPVFHYDFLTFDDQIYVTENPYVLTGLNSNSFAWAFHTTTSGNWIPLTWISHMLDFQWFGLKAGGHHLTNVLFHAANVVLLFLLLQKMTGAIWPCAFVAALFGWHPAHVESVAWIAERKDMLSSFFGLLAILAYVGYCDPGRARLRRSAIFHVLTIVLFALALMAKSMLVTLPFVLLLLDFWPLRRMSKFSLGELVLEKIPLFALSAACSVVTVWAQEHSNAVASAGDLSLPHRLAHVFASYLDYIVMLIFPHGLAIFYPYPIHEQAAKVIGGIIVVFLVSALAIAAARQRPWLAVGWFWFLGMLVPVIGLVQAGDQAVADRYTYLPAIGLFIILAWGGAEAAARYPFVKFLGPIFACGLLVAAWQQIHYWKDTKTVFERARAVTQKNYLALSLLGSLRAADGHLDEAMALYREALRDKPTYAKGHFFFAHGLEQEGKIDEAKAEYAEALRLSPTLEPAHIFLGLLLARETNYDQAAAEYETVLKLNPRSATAHNDLARLLQTEGRLDESIPHYLAALQYDSSLAQAHNNLGIVYLQRGQSAQAVAQLREALRLNPGNSETEYNLALALNQQQQWKEAGEIWGKIGPSIAKNSTAQYQYGLALAHEGKTREAMGHYAQALLLTPDFPEALNALAWIAATDPRAEYRNGPQAVVLASQACALTQSQQPAMLLTLAAAYAETGRFTDAAAEIEKARRMAGAIGNQELEKRAASMQEVFAEGKPFRQALPQIQ